MTETAIQTGRQRFGRFRDRLREHGFRLQCQMQAEDDGVPVELWRATNTGTGQTARFVVITGAHGFDLFVESRCIEFESDIARLVALTGGTAAEAA